MARTETIAIDLGFLAPDFILPDVVSGKNLSLSEMRGEKATVIFFICNHCPYVQHIIGAIVALSNDFLEKGVKFIAINSNDIANYPEDAPDKMIDFAKKYHFSFPYLFDETQEIAKNYDAACTPDFNIFDENLLCVYRGNFDDATPKNNIPVTGDTMRKALEKIILGQKVENQKPSVGCNIKWK